MIPTRWVTQMEGQLADANRRLGSAEKLLGAGDGSRSLEEVYPGVMGAAMVRVWLTDEPWHTQRSFQDLSRMVREVLPSGFATLFEMKQEHRNFAGWRAEDARPLLDEANQYVAETVAQLERVRAAPGA